MKRGILSIFLLTIPLVWLQARPVDVQCARQIAKTVLPESSDVSVVAKDELLAEPAYYVFNSVDGKGFAIVSAEDSEETVLGYSDNGVFDADNMPLALREILDGYSCHVSEVRNGTAEPFRANASPSSHKFPKAVSALCSSSWSTSTPYNNLCPESNGERCLTGCVATAMSQIMYFHRYPQNGTGTVSIRFGGQTLELCLDDQPFDWASMLDSYKNVDYTSLQATAVAQLCQAAGYSVHMQYSTSFSGAYVSDELYALINNFSYSTTAKVYLRNSYSDEGWLNKIKAELVAGRPFIYGGYTTYNTGHNFICDGYNYKDLVHINWGWGGDYDGFYNFRILSPVKSKPEDGYSQNQQVIMGIKPMQEGEDHSLNYQICLCDSITYEQNGNYITLHLPSLTNESYVQASGSIYYVIMNGEEEVGNIFLSNYNGPIDVAGRSTSVDFSIPSGLPDGEYDLKLAFKPNDEDRWHWLETGDMLAVIHITVAGGSLTGSEALTNGIKEITLQDSSLNYNLSGQCVSANAKGLVIKNGRKILR